MNRICYAEACWSRGDSVERTQNHSLCVKRVRVPFRCIYTLTSVSTNARPLLWRGFILQRFVGLGMTVSREPCSNTQRCSSVWFYWFVYLCQLLRLRSFEDVLSLICCTLVEQIALYRLKASLSFRELMPGRDFCMRLWRLRSTMMLQLDTIDCVFADLPVMSPRKLVDWLHNSNQRISRDRIEYCQTSLLHK